MVHRWLGRGGVTCVLLLGCTPVKAPDDAGTPVPVEAADDASPARRAPEDRRVITTLQTRDHEVTVYGTAQGLRFTVAAAGGTVLAESLTKQDFAGSFPGLHRRFDSAFAEERGGWIDASREPRPVDSRSR